MNTISEAQMNGYTHALYDLKCNQVIDLYNPSTDTILYQKVLGYPPEHYADFEVLELEEAYCREDESCITKPSAIDADQFDYFLNVLPPARWEICKGWEIFFMSERYSGNITSIYGKRNGIARTMRNVFYMSHTDVADLFEASV